MGKGKRPGRSARRSAAAGSRRQQPDAAPAPPSWSVLEARARAEMQRSREAIEDTARGTAGSQVTTWRRGSSPSSVRTTR